MEWFTVSKALLRSKKSVIPNSPLSTLLLICSRKSTKQSVAFFPDLKPYWLGARHPEKKYKTLIID